jgi:hypothetical protein
LFYLKNLKNALKIVHTYLFQLVDKYLKSVDNSKALDKITGFLVGPVRFCIMRENASRTIFLAFKSDFSALGQEKISYPQSCG